MGKDPELRYIIIGVLDSSISGVDGDIFKMATLIPALRELRSNKEKQNLSELFDILCGFCIKCVYPRNNLNFKL